MKKKIIAAIIGMVLLVGSVIGFTGCSGTPSGTLELLGNLTSQQEGIWVSGEGKVTAVPDVAILNLGIEVQAATVAEAQAQAAEAMDKIMEALKNQGVDEKDIKTTNYNINDMTRWDEGKEVPEIYAYRVSNTVTVKVRNIDNTGKVIDAVAVAGGDFTRVNSIGFTVDDPSQYYEEARIEAVKDAAAKAKTLAETAGVTLGSATYITESSYVPTVYRGYDMVSEASGVPSPAIDTSISAGEMEITTTVQIAYAMK